MMNPTNINSNLAVHPDPDHTVAMKVLGYTTLVLALAGCTSHKNVVEGNVVERVAQQLRSGATQVDMARTADFVWDEISVFGPYYPKDDICRILKLTGPQCSAARITDVDEGAFLLVFTQRGAVSETVRFPRAIANFDESRRCLARGIGRNAAVFAVERRPEVYLVCR
jgi:hypothetical protein